MTRVEEKVNIGFKEEATVASIERAPLPAAIVSPGNDHSGANHWEPEGPAPLGTGSWHA